MREVAGNEYFYEAACCQAPFSFKTWVTPLVVNRAGGFLKREACICLERTSIHPWSQTIREELGGFEGETILTLVIDSAQSNPYTISTTNHHVFSFSTPTSSWCQAVSNEGKNGISPPGFCHGMHRKALKRRDSSLFLIKKGRRQFLPF